MDIADRLPHRMHIGLQKAGSTYLYNLLASNPHVMLSPLTEVNFFSGQYDNGLEWYVAQFPQADNAVDVSPTYFKHGTDAAARIAKAYGNRKEDLRFVLMLRNPIEYVHSHYQMHVLQEYFVAHPELYPEVPHTFKAFVKRYPEYLTRGDYAARLDEWLEYFDRSQFLIIPFERFVKDTDRVLQEMLAFWNIPYVPMKAASTSRNRAPRGRAVRMLRDVVVQVPALKAALKRSSVVQWVLDRFLTVHNAEKLSPVMRAKLRDRYWGQVQVLGHRHGVDTSFWEDFAAPGVL